MRCKKGQIPPAILVILIIVAFLIIDLSSTKYVEIDLSNYGDCSDINNITMNSGTTIGWTNSGSKYNVYYMTFNNPNDIIEIKPNEIYKIKYTERGDIPIRCGINRYNLQESTIKIKNWWELS